MDEEEEKKNSPKRLILDELVLVLLDESLKTSKEPDLVRNGGRLSLSLVPEEERGLGSGSGDGLESNVGEKERGYEQRK